MTSNDYYSTVWWAWKCWIPSTVLSKDWKKKSHGCWWLWQVYYLKTRRGFWLALLKRRKLVARRSAWHWKENHTMMWQPTCMLFIIPSGVWQRITNFWANIFWKSAAIPPPACAHWKAPEATMFSECKYKVASNSWHSSEECMDDLTVCPNSTAKIWLLQ